MKILFYPFNCGPFHGNTLEEKPIGGVETAVIRLARALDALGHDVTVLTTIRNPPPSRPRYIHHSEMKSLGPVDLLIAVRSWEAFVIPIPARKRLLWTGDAYHNLHTAGLGDKRVVSLFDGLLCVSSWQAETLCSASGYPREKTHILRNGVDLADFSGSEDRMRKRLIYSSNPQRGLVFLPLIFFRLKQRHPELELHVFSNAALFDMGWPPVVAADMPHQALLNLLKEVPDCTVHGTVLQKQLAREFMKSSILTYPSNIEETSCITVLEAQAAGCCVVTSAMGALEESVGGGGIIVREESGSDAFLDKFTEAVDLLLKDDSLFQQLSQKALEQSKARDWKKRAAELMEIANL